MQDPSGLWTPESLAARDDESGWPHIDHAICGLIMLRGIMVKSGALAADPEPKSVPVEYDPEKVTVTFRGVTLKGFDVGGAFETTIRDAGGTVRTWDQINAVVLDHPDPERPLPPRDVVESEWRAPNAADLEAPEPAAGDAPTVVDVAAAAEARYQRLLEHRVATGAYDVAEPVLIRDRRTEHGRQFWDRAEADEAAALELGPVSSRVLEVLKHADGGPMSFAYLRGRVDCYGQELLGILGALQVAGLVVKDAAGYSLPNADWPKRSSDIAKRLLKPFAELGAEHVIVPRGGEDHGVAESRVLRGLLE
jgi:hypothetical protein